MSATVLRNSDTESIPFKVNTGVKQGCVTVLTLFAFFVEATLHLIGNKLPNGIPIVYKTDGRLFNINHCKVKSKLNHPSIIELQ